MVSRLRNWAPQRANGRSRWVFGLVVKWVIPAKPGERTVAMTCPLCSGQGCDDCGGLDFATIKRRRLVHAPGTPTDRNFQCSDFDCLCRSPMLATQGPPGPKSGPGQQIPVRAADRCLGCGAEPGVLHEPECFILRDNLRRGGFPPNPQQPHKTGARSEGFTTTPARRCECGSAAVGSPRHSDWCPMKGTQNESI